MISSLGGIVIVAAPPRYRQKEGFVPTQTGHTIRQCRSPNRSRPAWPVRSQRKEGGRRTGGSRLLRSLTASPPPFPIPRSALVSPLGHNILIPSRPHCP